MNFYNEIDPTAAQWLRNLIAEGLIADGDVDERSICDVRPSDVAGYSQCHWFAGIGGWSVALRLAGVPDDYPIWTGSPPCQPFSQAGKQQGKDDDRHLWPVFFDLIRECNPNRIFGEQVSSAIAHGWYDDLCDDLEGEGYACGAVIAPACSVGAPHIRERLFWVADSRRERLEGGDERSVGNECASAERSGCTDRLADTKSNGYQRRREFDEPAGRDGAAYVRDDERLADAHRPDTSHGGWSNPDWLLCRDGQWRPTQPGIQPLVDGLPAAMDGLGTVSRVGALKGSGNAIVPQVAAAFIAAFFESESTS